MTTIREEAIQLRVAKKGLLSTVPKIELKDRHDLSIAYTPGVAEPCKDIKEDKNLAFEYTWRGNLVAIVTDGTRVLGLGDIGPDAAMPVMEGKAILFKTFGGVDAVPICLDTKDPEEFIKTVKYLQPSFAGINLEDISSPKCYEIENRLKAEMDIPVFHDDQHGTAIAALSALYGALRYVKKSIGEVKIVINGAGAAGTAIANLLLNAGAKNVIMVDSKGALYEGRSSFDQVQQALVQKTNLDKIKGKLIDIIDGADVLIGVSAPGAFTKEIIQKMNSRSIVFGLANPVPEIFYDEAIAAGAEVAGTGRSDAPHQVNNVTVFPGVFRGAFAVRASQINEEMKVAAARAISDLVSDDELKADFIVVDAFDPRVAPAVAAAVAEVAMKTGVARVQRDIEEVKNEARALIGRG